MWIWMTVISLFIYLVLGLVKIRYFDFNGEADWLLMLADERNRRCRSFWIWVVLLAVLITWPLVFFGGKPYLSRRPPGSKGIGIAMKFFHLQWAGLIR